MTATHRHPLVCAHRGASAQAPENTLAALALAMDQGADMAEVDVQLTADDQLVLIHDDLLDRTTDGRGRVCDLPLADLRALDAGAWFDAAFVGEKIPTLDEAIAAVAGRLVLNIELKIGSGAGSRADLLADRVTETVRAADLVNTCVLTSFDHKLIDRLQKREPDLRVGYILKRRWFTRMAKLCAAPVHVLSVERTGVGRDLVERAHAAGRKLHVWTVDDESEMRRLIELGVDAIITNEPGRLRRVLQAP